MRRFLLLVLILAPFSSIRESLAADEWLKDEVLKELAELRKEVFQLKQEIAALRGTAGQDAGQPPGEARRSLDELAGNRPALGLPSARLLMVVFSDYECPYCRRFVQETLPILKKKYVDKGKLRLVMRDFPLEFHASARSAAVAARCAGSAGRYWEMQDFLFGHQAELGEELYLQGAQTLGLDAAIFRACLKDSSVDREIARDVSLAEESGVRGTPAFLIGRVEGRQVVDIRKASGAMPPEGFARLLDARLKPP